MSLGAHAPFSRTWCPPLQHPQPQLPQSASHSSPAIPSRILVLSMSSNQVINAFDLLGQAEVPRDFGRLDGAQEPNLHVGWGEFRQSLASSVRALVGGPSAPRRFR